MSYELAFKASALKEWQKLGPTLRAQFKKKLSERLLQPHVPAAALSGANNLWRFRLMRSQHSGAWEATIPEHEKPVRHA